MGISVTALRRSDDEIVAQIEDVCESSIPL
jgi:hypothetical protein